MPFDLATAKPAGGFDLTTAKPISAPSQSVTALDGGNRPSAVSIATGPQESPGLLSRVGADWAKRAGNIGEMVSRNTDGVLGTINNIPRMGALAAGQVAGGINDIVGEGIKSAYNTIVPASARGTIENVLVKDPAAYWGKTSVGQAIGKGANALATAYGNLDPDARMALEGAGNLLTAVPIAKGTLEAGKEFKNVVSDIKGAISTPSADKVSTVIKDAYNRGIRPSVIGKGTFTKADNAASRAERAVKEIINQKDKLALTDEAGDVVQGALPSNLKQFSQAIEQAKNNIYQDYHQMATQAGNAGVTFDAKPIVSELEKASANLKNNPQVRDYAKSLIPEIQELSGQAPEVIESRIADLNRSLSGFYDGRVGQAKAQVDASVASLMRSNLDDSISKAMGDGYQDLKNKYGALRSIEKDVSHRATVFSRQNQKGLADFTDIFTGGEILGGTAALLAGNPAGAKSIISGLSGRFIKGKIKDLNNADNIVRRMFDNASSLMAEQEAGPKSYLGRLAKDVAGKDMRVADASFTSVPPQQSLPFSDIAGMLPSPGEQNFLLYTPEQAASLNAPGVVANRLGAKNISNVMSGGISFAEKRRLNALARGLSSENR